MKDLKTCNEVVEFSRIYIPSEIRSVNIGSVTRKGEKIDRMWYIYDLPWFVCDMIFIQRVVCFLSPSLADGIENTTSWIKTISHHKPWEILFIKYLFLLTLSFGGHGVGIHNVISKNYHMSECYHIDIKENMW
jgi:hypothetical protein